MHRAFRATFALALGLTIGVSSAKAQREVSIDRLQPALDRHGFIGVQGTRMPGHLQWDTALWVSWAEDLLEVGGGTEVVDHRLRTNAMVQLGLGSRFAAALDVPVVWFQSGEADLLDGQGELTTVAAGDPRLVLRARLLGEATEEEGRDERPEGFGLAALASVSAPVGADQAFTAERSAVTNLELLGDFHVLGAGIGLSLGWRHRFAEESIAGAVFRDELHYGLGLEVPVPVTEGLSALAEIRGWVDARDPFGERPQTGLEGDIGARWRHGDITLSGVVGTNFNANVGVGSPIVRGLVGVMWSPRVHDADGDGIPDDEDECVHLPEDFDGFEDEDGCLDPDNDQDLVPDDDDACPNEAAIEGRDADFDGCTDPVRDTDGDGIEDRDDACPRQPEDRDGFEDDDGCLDPDNDGDGLADSVDDCPDEPEDADGFEDDDGCPDPDNDGDGVPDEQDDCPDEPEDADGFEDDDGCPDPDNDRDGVLDDDDQCPEERETVNSHEDDDGCPDSGGRQLWRIDGEPGDPERVLRGAVRFGADGSLPPIGRLSVDQLARHILASWPHPARVALAPDRQDRAETLKAALIERGVPEARVRVVVDETLRGRRVRVTFASTEGDGATSDGAESEGEPSDGSNGSEAPGGEQSP